MRVKISAGEYRDLTEGQINQLAFVAWHVAFPGPYDGKPSEQELQQIARDALGSPQPTRVHRWEAHMNEERERAMFERHFLDQGAPLGDFKLAPDGIYNLNVVQQTWEGWKARASYVDQQTRQD